MNRSVIIAFAAACFFITGCQSGDDKKKAAENTNTAKAEEPAVSTEKTGTTDRTQPGAGDPAIAKAAVGYCECFNSNFKNIDPTIRQIFIKAGNSDQPLMVLQQELVAIKDVQEQQRLGKEMEKFGNSKALEECTNNLEKKYKLNENDPQTQRLVLKALEQTGNCDFVVALMRIGITQTEMGPNRQGTYGQ